MWFDERPSPNRLYRNKQKAKINGVCAGIADYFGISPLPVRLGALIALFTMTVPAIVGYLVASWLLDEVPPDLYESDAERAFWKSVRTEPSGTTHDLDHKFREFDRALAAMESYVTSAEYELNRKFRDLDK